MKHNTPITEKETVPREHPARIFRWTHVTKHVACSTLVLFSTCFFLNMTFEPGWFRNIVTRPCPNVLRDRGFNTSRNPQMASRHRLLQNMFCVHELAGSKCKPMFAHVFFDGADDVDNDMKYEEGEEEEDEDEQQEGK